MWGALCNAVKTRKWYTPQLYSQSSVQHEISRKLLASWSEQLFTNSAHTLRHWGKRLNQDKLNHSLWPQQPLSIWRYKRQPLLTLPNYTLASLTRYFFLYDLNYDIWSMACPWFDLALVSQLDWAIIEPILYHHCTTRNKLCPVLGICSQRVPIPVLKIYPDINGNGKQEGIVAQEAMSSKCEHWISLISSSISQRWCSSNWLKLITNWPQEDYFNIRGLFPAFAKTAASIVWMSEHYTVGQAPFSVILLAGFLYHSILFHHLSCHWLKYRMHVNRVTREQIQRKLLAIGLKMQCYMNTGGLLQRQYEEAKSGLWPSFPWKVQYAGLNYTLLWLFLSFL